jgi:RNA polymerase sigma-70 factor (ECF subfamily)
LFRQYEQPICSYLARLTGDTARAQELTQETFIRTYQALGRGDRWHNPRAWLYRVASRLATDDYRRRKLLQWLPLSNIESDGSQNVEATVTEYVVVQAVLDSLPPKYRVPLTLYVHEECTVAEIAETLEISVSAVKMRLSRAREKFRQAYEQASKSQDLHAYSQGRC